MTPQHAQNCERWLADTSLIKWLKDTEAAALQTVGNTLDQNQMLRAQGTYKGISELIKEIEAGAKLADTLRLRPQVPSNRDFLNGY